jgi:hypothetical protein
MLLQEERDLECMYSNRSLKGRIQDFVLGGTEIGEGSGEAPGVCGSEYTNTRHDKEIRGVLAPDRVFQVTSPFNLHSLLRNYLKLFGEDSCVLIHFNHIHNCSVFRHAPRSVVSKNSKLTNENVQNNYLAPSFRIPGVLY